MKRAATQQMLRGFQESDDDDDDNGDVRSNGSFDDDYAMDDDEEAEARVVQQLQRLDQGEPATPIRGAVRRMIDAFDKSVDEARRGVVMAERWTAGVSASVEERNDRIDFLDALCRRYGVDTALRNTRSFREGNVPDNLSVFIVDPPLEFHGQALAIATALDSRREAFFVDYARSLQMIEEDVLRAFDPTQALPEELM